MLEPQFQLQLNQDDKWKMGRPHFHEDIEILLSFATVGSFIVENVNYPLKEGALFLLPESTIHISMTNTKYKRYVMHISSKMLAELSTPQSDLVNYISGLTTVKCKILNPEDTRVLAKKFQKLNEPMDGSFCCDLKKNAQLLDFISMVVSHFESAPSAKGTETKFDKVSHILEYINEHLCEDITLQDIADHFFISKSYFCRLFKEASGFRLMEYVVKARIVKARQMLREGRRVQEVGEAVGFRDIGHFIRVFREKTGVSPGKYQKRYLHIDKE